MMQTVEAANDLAKQLTIGGALFITALWMILKYKPWERRNGHGNGKTEPKSGEQSIDFWKNSIRQVVNEAIKDEFEKRNEVIREILREENQSLLEDFRNQLEIRNSAIVDKIRDEIGKTRHDLRNEISAWALRGNIKQR